MSKGIIFAIVACFIWGLIFVVPSFMESFSAIEVAVGRYLFYGLISVLIFIKAKVSGYCRYPLSIWIRAFLFSLMASIGYYTFLVLALRYSTPAICTLVLGISPITIAFYGNWRQKERSYRGLMLPSFLILCGLVIINAPQLMESPSQTTYILGLICSFLALISWSWYAVANADFLKRNTGVAAGDWSTLMGVASLCWVCFFAIFLALFFREHIEIEKYFRFDSALISFLCGSAILGLLCSWVGGYLWNRASVYLPVSFAGQLMIFETLFGLIFVYFVNQRLPLKEECIGMTLFLFAIIYGIRMSMNEFQQKTSTPLKTNAG